MKNEVRSHRLLDDLKTIFDSEQIKSDDLYREVYGRDASYFNVTGYGMNSFVDYDNPIDIFTHLLIGSEGTLAFIASAEQTTLPLFSNGRLFFKASHTLTLDMEREKSGSASALLGFLTFLFGGILSPLTGIGNMLYTTSLIIVSCCVGTWVCTVINLSTN